MPAAKKLIEVALPLEAINAASAREKSIRHGHPSTLHLWWARRPLAAARAVIFTSLVDDPDDPDALPAFVKACRKLPGDGPNVEAKGDSPRMRLFDFIERLVTWEATTDEAIMEQARELIRIATNGKPPPLLDPFAGGGSIPLEAQRLGLEAHASDLNPVAVMINKAMIEIPPRFADMPPVNPRDRAGGTGGDAKYKGAAGLAADVRYYGEWMRERAFERIGHLYPKHNGETVIAWLWARTVTCPNPACGSTMPLISSMELSKKRNKRAWIVAHPDPQAKRVRFEVKRGEGKVPDPPKLGRGAKFKCLVCNQASPDQYLKDEGVAKRMGSQLIAIVTQGKHGRNYHSPTDEAVNIAESAIPEWLPVGEIADEPRAIWCKLYGLIDFADLFTPRQLVALTTFSDLVHEARELATRDALAAMTPHPPAPSPTRGEGGQALEGWDVKPKLRQAMNQVARDLRKNPTAAEERLWQAIRNRQVSRKKFRRQMPIGAFVVDFYCSSERLAIEVDGGIDDSQQEADRLRQELIESLGIRFLRLSNDEIMRDLPRAIAKIQQSLADSEQGDKSPSTFMGEGFGVGVGGPPLREGGRGARAYGEAVSVYLAFAVDRAADYSSSLCIWDSRGHVQKTFGRQALPMVWDFAETNLFGTKGIPWNGHLFWICKNMMTFPLDSLQATAIQADAQNQLPPPPPKINASLKTHRLAA